MTLKVSLVVPSLTAVSETFIRDHAERLPAEVTVVHARATLPPIVGDRPSLSENLADRALRKIGRLMTGRSWDWEITAGYIAAFRRCRSDVVLAEYGPTGVAVQKACEIAKLPLVVHFHGYDASKKDILVNYAESYRNMFQKARAVICVSRAMQERLIQIGSIPDRTHLNVCGIDCERFAGGSPREAPPIFLAVGRFVEKKGPYLTLVSFMEVSRRVPNAKLRMIGDGQLLGPCRDLACALGISHAVEFLGAQSHDVVASEMKQARAFVQHSIEASNGDCEGTPVAVLEAGASGLPVVSTCHAGIPDVVMDGVTGFVIAEKDVSSMADRMVRLATDPDLAARLGAAARKRILAEFTQEKSINGLYKILSDAVGRNLQVLKC